MQPGWIKCVNKNNGNNKNNAKISLLKLSSYHSWTGQFQNKLHTGIPCNTYCTLDHTHVYSLQLISTNNVLGVHMLTRLKSLLTARTISIFQNSLVIQRSISGIFCMAVLHEILCMQGSFRCACRHAVAAEKHAYLHRNLSPYYCDATGR